MIHQFLFEPIHMLAKDILIKNLALILSYPVTYGIIILLVIWTLFFSSRKIYTFSLLFLTGLTAWFVAHFIKVMLRVPRPFVEMHFTPLQFEPGFSFPSEHMTVLIALAFAVSLVHKKFGGVLLAVALAVGISRIIIGVHYPVDILGGALLGYLVYLPYKKIFRKL